MHMLIKLANAELMKVLSCLYPNTNDNNVLAAMIAYINMSNSAVRITNNIEQANCNSMV